MPDPEWSPVELAAIEKWMATPRGYRRWRFAVIPVFYTREEAEAAVLRARPKGPEAPGERTPTEERADILQAVLAKLDIRLGPKEFEAFLKDTHAAFGLQKALGKFDGTWKQFLDSLSIRRQREVPVAEGMAPALLPSPLENYLDQWRGVQEEQRAAAAEEAEQQKATERVAKALKVEVELEEDRFQGALTELSRRYPANKVLIQSMKPQVLQAWRAARQRARDEFDSLPPELREGMGVWQPPDIPANTFVQTYDWAATAETTGIGELWQQGLFRDAFAVNVAEPMRSAAKTPAEKLSVEAQIAQLEALVTPALKNQFLEAARSQPGLDMNQYLQTDAAKAIVGEATRSLQNRIRPGEAQTVAQRFAQEVDAIYDMTMQGYDPAFIAKSLNIAESAVTRIAQPATVLRQSQVTAATLSLGGFVAQPAGEVRGGEFGQEIFPQSVRQYVQTPTTVEQLRERDAALNALTGGRYGQLAYQGLVAQSRQATAELQARAGEAQQSNLRLQIAQLTGRSEYAPVSNEPELRSLVAQLQQKKAADLQKEQYRTAALEVLKPAFDDPVFAKELDYFEAQNARITAAAGLAELPDTYETREQVMVRLAPQVAKMYDEYLAKKKQAPQLPAPTRVL